VDLTPIEARLADFGVYWGVRLVLDTLRQAQSLIESDGATAGLDAEGLERAGRMLADGERAFVLPDEIYWPQG